MLENIRSWLIAIRIRTLLISFPSIIAGTFFVYANNFPIHWNVVLYMILCSLSVQIGTNLMDDALDFMKKTDTDARMGPQKVLLKKRLTFNQVYYSALLCFGLTVLFGIPLIFIGGWPLVAIIVLAILSGYCYTGGPYPLAFIGISGLFIFLFFGIVSTGAVYYLQTGELNRWVFLIGSQTGLLLIVPSSMNNLRDSKTDALVHKMTTAVRFGEKVARWEIAVLSVLPFLIGCLWFFHKEFWAALFPYLVFFPILDNVQSIWIQEPSEKYNLYQGKSVLYAVAFSLLLGLGFIFSRFS